MKLSAFKKHLENLDEIHFFLPDHKEVPPHFHITEIGLNHKQFIDCGGTYRTAKTVTFQLWTSVDTDHRLTTEKLLKIISIGEEKMLKEDLEVEIEYQADTIGKFGVEFDGKAFYLTAKQTDCLAKENCGVPELQKAKRDLKTLTESACCTPGTACC